MPSPRDSTRAELGHEILPFLLGDAGSHRSGHAPFRHLIGKSEVGLDVLRVALAIKEVRHNLQG